MKITKTRANQTGYTGLTRFCCFFQFPDETEKARSAFSGRGIDRLTTNQATVPMTAGAHQSRRQFAFPAFHLERQKGIEYPVHHVNPV